MATVGVVNYSASSPHKLNILQQSVVNNSANVDSKRQIIILRKGTKLFPETVKTENIYAEVETSGPSVTNTALSNILVTNSAKRKNNKPKEMTRIQNPPPVAVARRNARERNRVKQVNNGFATLRQHIPTAIASTYETGSGRGSNKKLSKVETLRMAVEYIKSLESLLSISSGDENHPNSPMQSYSLPTASPSSQISLSYSYPSSIEDDDLSFDISRQYNKKLSMRNAYHLINSDMYEDEENINPSNINGMEEDLLGDSAIVDTNLELSDSHDISHLHAIDNTASLSPEVYSEHSMSPSGIDPNDTKSFIPVFNVPNPNIIPSFTHISYERLPQVIKAELMSPNATQASGMIDTQEMNTQGNMIEVMSWWEQQQTMQQTS